MKRVYVPVMAALLCAVPQRVGAARLAFAQSALSFEAPAGFQKVPAPGFLWCGKSKAGERLTVQLWRRKTGLASLGAASSERLYPRLHRYQPVRIVKRGGLSELQGAPSSLVAVERKQNGQLYRSYQVLALERGELYVFEYTGPVAQAETGVTSFAKLLSSVQWKGRGARPVAASPTAPAAPTASAAPTPSLPKLGAPISLRPVRVPELAK